MQEQHCLVMAELCESILDTSRGSDDKLTKVGMGSKEGNKEPEPMSSADGRESLSSVQSLPSSQLDPPPTKQSKSARKMQALRKKNRDFLEQMKRANDFINQLDFKEGEIILKKLSKEYTEAIYSARIDQTKAWCCKIKIDHIGQSKREEKNEQLFKDGWKHVVSGVEKITGLTISRNHTRNLEFDNSQLSTQQKRCLASLLSTAAHLSSLEAGVHYSKRLSDLSRSLYHMADVINPERLQQCAETIGLGNGVQVIDAQTFEMLKTAMKDRSS